MTMRFARVHVLLVLCSGLLPACGDDDAGTDAGEVLSSDAATDAREVADGATTDGGEMDAAVVVEDAGASDVNALDAPAVDTMDTPFAAFPEAEGFGAVAIGGRGGRVIQVTNLDDSGPGSFREACEALSLIHI